MKQDKDNNQNYKDLMEMLKRHETLHHSIPMAGAAIKPIIPKSEEKTPLWDREAAKTNNVDESKPKLNIGKQPEGIFTIEEGNIMPLFLINIPSKMLNNSECSNCEFSVMGAIQHHVKDNMLEIKGRVKCGDKDCDGNCIIFGAADKIPFSKENLIESTKILITLMAKTAGTMLLAPAKTPLILHFEPGEKTESIMEKLEKSDMFNIYQVN